MQGSAAAKRDALKYRGNNGHRHPGHTLISASVETYGYCVCVPLMVSCSGFGLPLHAQLLRLFVTRMVIWEAIRPLSENLKRGSCSPRACSD